MFVKSWFHFNNFFLFEFWHVWNIQSLISVSHDLKFTWMSTQATWFSAYKTWISTQFSIFASVCLSTRTWIMKQQRMCTFSTFWQSQFWRLSCHTSLISLFEFRFHIMLIKRLLFAYNYDLRCLWLGLFFPLFFLIILHLSDFFLISISFYFNLLGLLILYLFHSNLYNILDNLVFTKVQILCFLHADVKLAFGVEIAFGQTVARLWRLTI